MSIKSVMPSNHLILCHPLLLLPSIFPRIRIFPVSQFFTSGGQSTGVLALASVLPMNIQDWFPLGLTWSKKIQITAWASWSCVEWINGEGNGTPLQYFYLENPMDGGAWWAAVHGVAKSRTRLSDFTFSFQFYALEKEVATHSSVLAWRIPGMGSQRVGHDWSELAATSRVD